jgi:DNA-binding transcriptional ArsR family regulator
MMINRNKPLPPPRVIPVGGELPPMDDPAPSSNGRQRHRDENRDKAKPKGKTAERFAVLNAFVDFELAELSRAELAVWLILYRDTRDGTARTSYDDLARRAGLNRRNVGRAVRRLEGRGLVRIVHRGGLRRGVSRYCVQGLPKDG